MIETYLSQTLQTYEDHQNLVTNQVAFPHFRTPSCKVEGLQHGIQRFLRMVHWSFTQMSWVGQNELDVIKLTYNFLLGYLWRILTAFGLSQRKLLMKVLKFDDQTWDLIRNPYDSCQICSSCRRLRCKASKGWTPGVVFWVGLESTLGNVESVVKHQKVEPLSLW